MDLELLGMAKTVSPPLKGNDLTTAINHLYKSLELIGGARGRIEKGMLDGVFTSDDLAEGWHEVNKCRLYTEAALIIEEYLQPAMGLINDAKCMIDSLMAWGLGMTRNGKIHIINCLEEAESAIHGVLEELESWMTTTDQAGACESCGRKYTYGDRFCSSCGHKLGELVTH